MVDEVSQEVLGPTRKLTEDAARTIYHHPGTISGIAREFGVSRRHVRLIKDGVKWPVVAREAASEKDTAGTVAGTRRG